MLIMQCNDKIHFREIGYSHSALNLASC